MAALSLFQQTRKLKTANWAKQVHSQFTQKIFGCQPKNIFSIPAPGIHTGTRARPHGEIRDLEDSKAAPQKLNHGYMCKK